jgi:dipicolinate synthase subunit A
MLQNKAILVAGGDLRQSHLAKLLAAENRVYTLGLEKAEGLGDRSMTIAEVREKCAHFDYIVLPMPVGNEDSLVNTPFSALRLPVDDVLSCASADTHVLGGKFSDSLAEKLRSMGLRYTDYNHREEFAILNAIPTAEGAVQIAMEELATTIFGMNVCIIGYGRIGKVLTRTFSSLGAEVTVSARKFADLAWIRTAGCRAVHNDCLHEVLPEAQLVVNTVPVPLLGEELLTCIRPGCLLIDLASKPGGVDFTTANRLGIKTIWALSLPGKVAPISAGEIIYETIQNIESEKEAKR